MTKKGESKGIRSLMGGCICIFRQHGCSPLSLHSGPPTGPLYHRAASGIKWHSSKDLERTPDRGKQRSRGRLEALVAVGTKRLDQGFPREFSAVRSQPGWTGGREEESGKGETRTVTGFVAVPPTVDTNNAGSTSGCWLLHKHIPCNL